MKTKATLVNEMKKPFWKKNAVSVAVASAALIFISGGGHITRPLVKGIE